MAEVFLFIGGRLIPSAYHSMVPRNRAWEYVLLGREEVAR